jgi:hypothetical protein
VAENDIIFEDGAIRFIAICDDLPTSAMAKEATDFCLGERRGYYRTPIGRVYRRNAIEGYANTRKFCCHVSQPIN